MTVRIRIVTFIPYNPLNSNPPTNWIYLATVPLAGGTTTMSYYYLGDQRGFTPHTANTGDFRTAQQIHIDFNNRTHADYKNTGYTHQKSVMVPPGSESIATAKADPKCLSVTWLEFPYNYCKFNAKCNCENPMVSEFAPAINYDFTITLHASGSVQLVGSHDRFPAYEIYKSFDDGVTWATVYKYDPRTAGVGVSGLFPGNPLYVNKWA